MLKKILNKAPYRIFLALFVIIIISFASCFIILSISTSAINSQMRQNLLNFLAKGDNKESKDLANHIIKENIESDISYIKFFQLF